MIPSHHYRPNRLLTTSSACARKTQGYFFDVITNGFGAMPDYASQVAPRDRWAIVAYIRALQFDRAPPAADVPAGRNVPSEPPRFEELGSGATLPVVETKPAHEEPK